jgi:hypothetical protein
MPNLAARAGNAPNHRAHREHREHGERETEREKKEESREEISGSSERMDITYLHCTIHVCTSIINITYIVHFLNEFISP